MSRTVVRLGLAMAVLAAIVIAIAVVLGLASSRAARPVPFGLKQLAQLPAEGTKAQLPGWLAAGDGTQWTTQLGDYAGSRFSPLAEISAANVGRLKPAFTFDDGLRKGHEPRSWSARRCS